MPYVTRKKVKLFIPSPLILGIQLDDDSLPKHYVVLNGVGAKLRGTVTLIADKDDHVKYVNRDYEFEVESTGHYTDKGRVVYDRHLWFPRKLTNDFALDVDMGVEVLFNEIVSRNTVEKIFPETVVEGSKEFEPKATDGEALQYSELLVSTKFADEFYDKLVLEINSAFRVRLFTATMVLIRKLFENLIIDLLRQKYGDRPPDKELYYSMKDRRYHSFSTLIHNFETHVDDFSPYNVGFQWGKSKNEFFKFLWGIKERGDACAHSIELIHDPSEINTLKPPIDKYSDLIVRLRKIIMETPHSQ
jgi:hypothetical protein